MNHGGVESIRGCKDCFHQIMCNWTSEIGYLSCGHDAWMAVDGGIRWTDEGIDGLEEFMRRGCRSGEGFMEK